MPNYIKAFFDYRTKRRVNKILDNLQQRGIMEVSEYLFIQRLTENLKKHYKNKRKLLTLIKSEKIRYYANKRSIVRRLIAFISEQQGVLDKLHKEFKKFQEALGQVLIGADKTANKKLYELRQLVTDLINKIKEYYENLSKQYGRFRNKNFDLQEEDKIWNETEEIQKITQLISEIGGPFYEFKKKADEIKQAKETFERYEKGIKGLIEEIEKYAKSSYLTDNGKPLNYEDAEIKFISGKEHHYILLQECNPDSVKDLFKLFAQELDRLNAILEQLRKEKNLGFIYKFYGHIIEGFFEKQRYYTSVKEGVVKAINYGWHWTLT